jgi:hypothetical protein
MNRVVSVNPECSLGFVDHLAPLLSLLKGDFLFVDPLSYETAKALYPDVSFKLVPPETSFELDLHPHYRYFLACTIIPKEIFQRHFSPLKSLFVPHGNSDKGYIATEAPFFKEPDHLFIYGEKMRAYLEDKGVFHEFAAPPIYSGNYRLSYYKKHKTFYDRLIYDTIGHKLSPHRKTILYAPTWGDGCTLFSHGIKFLENLTDDYQVIIKAHPFLLDHYFGQFVLLKERFKDDPKVHFLEDFPPIYPLLNIIDYYIGDYSSIGYDYLAFNRPLFFFYKKPILPLALYQVGTLINEDDAARTLSILERPDLLQDVRQKLYHFTFGEEESFSALEERLRGEYLFQS